MQGPIHAWDCPCGTRNAPQFTACRQCRRPIIQGRPVYPTAGPQRASVVPPPLPRAAFPQQAPHPQGQSVPSAVPSPTVPVSAAPAFYPRPQAIARRLAAWLIDFGLGLAVAFLVAISAERVGSETDAGGAIQAIGALLLMGMGFAWITLWAYRQTPGMKLMKLRMIGPDGRCPGWGRALLRWVAQTGSINCLFVGYLWMFWDPDQQTWHDRASGIRVVKA